ncbi:hypothetical protein F5144DRAFT_660093 [Chaetomium tenue]|uniref:Uncharacterized protein n=1 Tax=Chaetomium tenue TaxID=1854479 RepID=A0ACB7NVF1_9PEZI|nr:hypothetical protein F5144DRAFT_660093 [Chaetomium globosum]
MPSPPLTYIPPLLDGACGTTPHSQHPLPTALHHELTHTLPLLPTLCRALLLQRFLPHPLYLLLACFEVGVLLAAVPLWFVLPGVVFAGWVAGCVGVGGVVVGWGLNGGMGKGERVLRCDAAVDGEGGVGGGAGGGDGWMMGQEVAEDEKWLFLGGMGMSSRRCHERTLPALSRLFNRPVVCVCMPTYGMPFDILAMMLQRCFSMPSQVRRTLYSQMRSALLDDAMNRCVVLCHNDSAVIVSQAVAQLCADLPPEKLRKLEIYTFGAAASEFMMPLGDKSMELESVHQAGDYMHERRGIHIEHFAMTNDPFAQMGVLQSVRQNMESRFCGSVFVMNDTAHTMQTARPKAMPTCSGLAMEDYLMALFPTQMAPDSPTMMRSVLDSVMTIDRDCAEKREIAAMSNYHAASQAKKGGKRLSWTGLATMAGQKNGMNAGMVALEMARKGCKSCEGRKGREISWLARYVAMEGKQAGEERQ